MMRVAEFRCEDANDGSRLLLERTARETARLVGVTQRRDGGMVGRRVGRHYAVDAMRGERPRDATNVVDREVRSDLHGHRRIPAVPVGELCLLLLECGQQRVERDLALQAA